MLPDYSHVLARHPTGSLVVCSCLNTSLGKPPTILHLVMSQVVGVVALFFAPAPILLKQGYLVTTGVVTAYLFTFIPEWTTWVMLVAMALYDLCAVLTPHGPLKVKGTLALPLHITCLLHPV